MPEPLPEPVEPTEPPELMPDAEPEPEPEPEPIVTPAEKTYAELGLNERYDKMNREQLAADIQSRNTSFGHQSEVLGKLRGDLAARDEQIANFKKAANLPVEVKKEVQKMGPDQLGRWLDELQTDPDAAIRSLLGDSLGRRSDEELTELINKGVNEGLQGYHGYTEDQAARSDPDYPRFAGYIEQLQGKEHFGNTRPPGELLDLARLVIADKASGDAVYDTMKRFPGVPMKDCIHMVNGRPGAKTTVDADKIRKQVKELAGGGLPGGASQKSKTEVIENMDQAFDADNIDG